LLRIDEQKVIREGGTMPLTGQAKRDYQRQYMRDYRRQGKGKSPAKKRTDSVRPSLDPVRPDVRPLKDLQAAMDAIVARPITVEPLPPVYNPRVHKPGDTVLMKGKVVIIPEIDAEGNLLPNYD
jgi:hypothetical protein